MKDFFRWLWWVGIYHNFWKLFRRVKPGKDLHGEELYYVTGDNDDPNYGKPLKILRHVYVMTDPDMDWRPCYVIRLPNGRTRRYLDPGVSNMGQVLTKAEAGL